MSCLTSSEEAKKEDSQKEILIKDKVLSAHSFCRLFRKHDNKTAMCRNLNSALTQMKLNRFRVLTLREAEITSSVKQ